MNSHLRRHEKLAMNYMMLLYYDVISHYNIVITFRHSNVLQCGNDFTSLCVLSLFSWCRVSSLPRWLIIYDHPVCQPFFPRTCKQAVCMCAERYNMGLKDITWGEIQTPLKSLQSICNSYGLAIVHGQQWSLTSGKPPVEKMCFCNSIKRPLLMRNFRTGDSSQTVSTEGLLFIAEHKYFIHKKSTVLLGNFSKM